jgi:hypothetical protein
MDWILIGIVSGTLIAQGFGTKEACLGRGATLKEAKIESKCVEAPRTGYTLSSGTVLTCCINGVCGTPCN